MIARNYGSPTLIASKIEEELDANVLIHETDAGRLLGLPASSQSATGTHTAGGPNQDDYSYTGTSNPDPPLAAHTSRSIKQEQRAPQPHSTSLGQVILETVSWILRNFDLPGANSGGNMRRSFARGDPFRGGGDRLSPVDFMKSKGMDSSRAARLRYAQQHGIEGVPFSAAWGEAMLRHLQRHG
ncbi:hypothetical protein BDV09DRAFT_190304 [Aspergillus tetrazonus]